MSEDQEKLREEARQNLQNFIPYLKAGLQEAARHSGCAVELGILVTKEDGSGKVLYRFETNFVKDLEILVGP